MKILVIEDTAEELAKAVEIGTQMGLDCIGFNPDNGLCGGDDWTAILRRSDVIGVVTDLFWRPAGSRGRLTFIEDKAKSPPSGLLVVVDGLLLGKPVVICTSEQGHNEKTDFISNYLGNSDCCDRRIGRSESAFRFVDDKDWKWAFQSLKRRLSEQGKPTSGV